MIEVKKRGGTCSIIELPKEICSIEFTDLTKEEIIESSDIGSTCRDEMVIVHYNKNGKIVEIELAGGDKPCSE